jgi:hypothetical protein
MLAHVRSGLLRVYVLISGYLCYVRLGQVRSGYDRLGQVKSGCQVSSG